MKRSLFSKLTLAALLFFAAQTGFAQERETRDVSSFNQLSVSSAFVVEVSVGDVEALEVEAEERILDDIITEVRNGRLVIKLRDSRDTKRMRDSPRAYVTVTSLESIGISGAVKLTTFDPIKTERFKLNISGASVAKVEVECEDLRVEASGASEIVMEGKANSQFVRTSGATSYSAYNLETYTAEIKMSGAGSARISVADELDCRLSGASDVRYKGSPKVNSSTSGASSVRRGR